MSLVNKSYYSFVFDDYTNKSILLCLPIGNIGDGLIWSSCYQLLDYYSVRYEVLRNNNNIQNQLNNMDMSKYDFIMWCGGGNMGSKYLTSYLFRMELSKICKRHNKPIIILPSTWTSHDDVDAYKYYARDYISISTYENRGIFCHDLSLAYDLESDIINTINISENSIGFFFRKDSEKSSYIHPNNSGDPAHICKGYKDYFYLASKYDEIHTNRLHFAIAAAIINRKVKLYSNSYFKNRAVYDSSLKQFSNIEFVI